jgi:hypothetical protein
MPRRGYTRAQDLIVAERRAYVFRLRQTGATFLDIRRIIQHDPAWQGRLPKSYSERQAHRDVVTELQRLRAELAELVEDVRQVELARLDRLLLAYWERALGDEERQIPGDLEAGRFILQLMDRRARYLPGLDSPLHVAPTTPDGTAPYRVVPEAPEHFFAELATIFQQLAPGHMPAGGGAA